VTVKSLPAPYQAGVDVEIRTVAEKKNYAKDGTLVSEFSLEVPVITGGENGVAGKINAVFDRMVEDQYGGAQKALDNMAEDAIKMNYNQSPMTDVTTCKISYQDQNYLSFALERVTYGGGAHGRLYGLGYTFDLRTGEELRIDDVLNVTGDTVVDVITREWLAQRQVPESWDIESVRDQSGLDALFWLEDEGVHICYSEYTFYFMAGRQDIVIPWSRTDLIKIQVARQGGAD
jgi:hypothetical protein